jgi:hypothetical protein
MRPSADITSRLKFADNQPPVIKARQRASWTAQLAHGKSPP